MFRECAGVEEDGPGEGKLFISLAFELDDIEYKLKNGNIMSKSDWAS